METLDQYMTKLKADVASFHAWWLEQSKESPEDFPLKMAPDEWHEQFVIWMEMSPEDRAG